MVDVANEFRDEGCGRERMGTMRIDKYVQRYARLNHLLILNLYFSISPIPKSKILHTRTMPSATPSATYTYAVQPTAPWAVSTKTSAYTAASQPYQPSPVYGQLYQPPPSRSESITTGGGSYSIPSRAQSVSSYSGSESNSPVDALGYMGERLNRAMDPTPLDRSLAVQAQR